MKSRYVTTKAKGEVTLGGNPPFELSQQNVYCGGVPNPMRAVSRRLLQNALYAGERETCSPALEVGLSAYRAESANR